MNLKTGIWIVKSLYGIVTSIPLKHEHPILIVEDDDNDAELLERHCKKFGAKVVRVNTLRKAHDAVLTQKFRLAFVDAGMPDGSGVDFARDLPIPVSIVTGDNYISTELTSGKNWGLILKGTSGGSLQEAVEDAILKSNGVNGHVQPGSVIVISWIITLLSLAMGLLFRELLDLIHRIK